MAEGYTIVRLANGTFSVRSLAESETFHPGIGPVAEAEALYAVQLELGHRAVAAEGGFVIWDVGLGAAANAVTSIRHIAGHVAKAAREFITEVRLASFDRTTRALEFALGHREELSYLCGFESALKELIACGTATIEAGKLRVVWTLHRGEFPLLLAEASTRDVPAPQAILFDPHSPRKNPEMWTVALFENLLARVDDLHPCVLANFTRSTMARTAMLLGGWFVGAGRSSGMKEETTIAASHRGLLKEPLDQRWLERARRSDSAEPLREAVYSQSRLSEENWQRLCAHPQFAPLGT
ncbi:MAG TPA: MnmC family methyltransferase [Verrucomicrobiae bacterium]|nr:MnmC family methyltransferase [Verrucomicrobiae bacterium]